MNKSVQHNKNIFYLPSVCFSTISIAIAMFWCKLTWTARRGWGGGLQKRNLKLNLVKLKKYDVITLVFSWDYQARFLTEWIAIFKAWWDVLLALMLTGWWGEKILGTMSLPIQMLLVTDIQCSVTVKCEIHSFQDLE